MRTPRILHLLGALLACLPLAAAQGASEWRATLERDARYSFTDRSAGIARIALDDAQSTPQRRAAAWVAIGCAGAVAERARAEEAARSTKPPEQLGAIFCVGKLAAGGTATLRDLARSDGVLGDAAWLSMLFQDDLDARRGLEEMAADTQHPRRAVSEELLLYRYDTGASRETPAVRAWLTLREGAARQFGLYDGEMWSVRALRALAADEAFVREVVVGASPRIAAQGVKDYLLHELVDQASQARFEAAVATMPAETAQLVANGIWLPRTAPEWLRLLDEIELRRCESLVPEILAAARATPFRLRAVELSAHAGDTGARLDWVDASKLRKDAKQALCSAIGALRSPAELARFAAFASDADPGIVAAWLVAGLRVGQPKARMDVERALSDTAHPMHREIVDALCRDARDPSCAMLLEARLDGASGREKLDIAVALTREGRTAGRPVLRERLQQDPAPRGAAAADMVDALRRNATSEDLVVFNDLFPRGDDLPFDTQLAIALGALGSPEVVPLLRAGLWNGQRDIALLAAAELVAVHGMHFLLDEVQSPPREADDADLRRAGYAVGTWGGIDAVERLSRARRGNVGDPVLQGAVLGAMGARTR